MPPAPSYTETFWREKGAECARRGFGITSAFINDQKVNAFIRAGYDAEFAKMAQEISEAAR
jgi:hypothetical protein